ncbi:hypothetical protein ACHWQZ_G007810 [Mnemiopsis leidyi]
MADLHDTMITNMDATLNMTHTSKILLLTFYLHVMVICVLGNGMILKGTFGRGAIKTDKVTVVCVEALALLDFTIAIFHVIPVMVTLASGRWMMGSGVCLLNAFISRALYINEIFLTVAISCYRLWMLKQPRAVRRSINILYARAFLLILTAISFGCAGSQLHQGGARFEPQFLSCSFTQVTGKSSPKLMVVGSTIFLALPMMLIVVINILIVTIVSNQSTTVRKSSTMPILKKGESGTSTFATMALKKRHKGYNQSTFVTISLVCLVFVCCYTPTFILTVSIAAHCTPPDWFYSFTVAFLTLTIAANPFLYGATNRSFREYVLSTIGSRYLNTLKEALGTIKNSLSGFVPLENMSGSNFASERSKASDVADVLDS